MLELAKDSKNVKIKACFISNLALKKHVEFLTSN